MPQVSQLPLHLSTPPTAADRAVVLADGEHYPSAVADAVARLRRDGWQVASVALLGGTEKLRGNPDYGVPHVTGDDPAGALRAALDAHEVDCVIDLADEPVLAFERRTQLIGLVAGRGLRYLGPDAVIEPPTFATVGAPTLAIVGTGKRIGKTAVSAHAARLADAELGGDGAVVVVAMGRGGPAEPVVVDRSGGKITVERLLSISRDGAHAASDYLEDAALTGLTTVGCRRVGGGLLGVPVDSNVPEGARMAADLARRLVVLEGSGSCIPPVAASRTLLLASTARPQDLLEAFGPYRLERADMLLVMGDDRERAQEMLDGAARLRPDLNAFSASLVPTPVEDVDGARVAAFTTAPTSVESVLRDSLRRAGVREVVLVSHALARRDELRDDVRRALDAGCDTFAVEIKAAAIDVVAEAAADAGIRVAWLDNLPVAHDANVDLDAHLRAIAASAVDAGPAGG